MWLFRFAIKSFLNFPIWFYNILLNYDVSLHNLVVLIVTIPTSLRLSKTEFICKSYGALNLPLDLPRSWSGVSGHTGVSGPNDRSLRSLFFAAVCVCCGAVLLGVRSSPGEGPESPAHRSLRPEDPESPAPIFLSPFALCGAPLDRGPEHPRRVPGVSGPKDRNLRPPR